MMAKAVMIGLDGYERVIDVPEPPPSDYRIPIRVPLRVVAEDVPHMFGCRYRIFRLSHQFRSREHQWMEIYNEGRTQTPRAGYVYFEQRQG